MGGIVKTTGILNVIARDVLLKVIKGCGLEYIPYCWFIFLVPVFAIVCAVTGIGMWDADGNRMWGKYKGMKGAPGKEPAQPVK